MIQEVRVVIEGRRDKFEAAVKLAVDDMQAIRLNVEIQYAGNDKGYYTAMILGRR